MENVESKRLKEFIDYLKYNKMIYNETDFCEKAGFVKSFLSDMKNGKKKITAQSVMKIVLAFPFVNPLWLLYGEGEMVVSFVLKTIAKAIFPTTIFGVKI